MSLEAGFVPEEYAGKEVDVESTQEDLEHPELDQATAWALEVITSNRPKEEIFLQNWHLKDRSIFLYERDRFFSRKSKKGGVGLFENEGQQYGLILEGLFADPKFSEAAFGKQIAFRPATRWDDAHQGTDSLLTLKSSRQDKDFVIAIDFTIGESRNYLQEKFKKSFDISKKSELVEPMYENPFSHKIESHRVPKLLVVVDRVDLDECITPWLNDDYKGLSKTNLANLVMAELYYEMEGLSNYLNNPNSEDENKRVARYLHSCKTRLAELAEARGIDYKMEKSDRVVLDIIKRTLAVRLQAPREKGIGSFRIVN